LFKFISTLLAVQILRMVRSMIALALAPLTSAALLQGERDLSEYTYEHYQKEFNKVADAQRKEIFEQNMEFIRTHNAQEDKTWFATVNEFADWDNEEFRAHRTGHRPDHQTPRVSLSSNLGDLPDAHDWRDTDGVITPVKNQAQCGSCWAFSAVQSLESHLAIATGEAAPILSPQQIVSCAPNPDHCGGTGGCKGSTQPLAFNYTAGAGITLDSDYPYTSGPIGITGKCKEEKINPVATNDGVEVLETNDYTALMTAVHDKGPISISVAAGGIGWQLYGGGVYSGSGLGGCSFVVDHAVHLVGYGVDSDMYWQVRNSWGGSWGESGYMRVKRFGEGSEPCGMDKKPQDGMACEGDTDPIEYCGLCGILSSSSYPTGMKKVGSEIFA